MHRFHRLPVRERARQPAGARLALLPHLRRVRARRDQQGGPRPRAGQRRGAGGLRQPRPRGHRH